jgi:hypothetical protein
VRAMRGTRPGRPRWVQGYGQADIATPAWSSQGFQHCVAHLTSPASLFTQTCASQASGSCWTAPASLFCLCTTFSYSARERAGDTGLLDHLLKHLADEAVSPCGEVLRRRHNAQGHMDTGCSRPRPWPRVRAHAQPFFLQGSAWSVSP